MSTNNKVKHDGETTETGTKKVLTTADLNEIKHAVSQRIKADFAEVSFTDEQRNKIMDDVVNEFYLDTIVDFTADRVEKRTLAAFGRKRWWADRLATSALQTLVLGAAVGGTYAISKNLRKPLFGGRAEGSVGNANPFSRTDAVASAPRSLRGNRRDSVTPIDSASAS